MTNNSTVILQYYRLSEHTQRFQGTLGVILGESECEIRNYQSGDPVHRAIWRFQDHQGYPLIRSQKDFFLRKGCIYIDNRKPMQFGPKENTRTHRALKIAFFLQKIYREFGCELSIQSGNLQNQKGTLSIWIGDSTIPLNQFQELSILTITPYVPNMELFDSEWRAFGLPVEDIQDFIKFLEKKVSKDAFHTIFPRFPKK